MGSHAVSLLEIPRQYSTSTCIREYNNTNQHGSFEDSETSIYKQSRVQNCSLKQIQPVVLIGDRFSLPASLQHPSPATVSHEDAAGLKI